MASNSGWNKDIPSGSSAIAQGDDEIRSFKSHMQAWWEQEHYATDGSTTSAGIHKPGSARAFVAASSALSNPTADNDGRLFFATDTNQMFVANVSTSSWSVFADNIQLSSTQTWTGLQQFNAGASSAGSTLLGPTRKDIYFSRTNVTSSTSHTASRAGTPAAHEFANHYVMGRTGSITGIFASYNENITAGSISINPAINNAPSASSTSVNVSTSSHAQGGAGHTIYSTFSTSQYTFTAGDWLSCYVVGDASLAPSGTGDFYGITVELTFEDE